MKAIGTCGALIMFAMVVPMLACTWVPLTSGGQSVRILQASEVANCEKIAETTSRTSDRVIIFARSDRKVREELDSLARNEAADLGGDAIVPIGTADDGRQSFGVYRCESP
jgi:hypothetical protein